MYNFWSKTVVAPVYEHATCTLPTSTEMFLVIPPYGSSLYKFPNGSLDNNGSFWYILSGYTLNIYIERATISYSHKVYAWYR